MDAGKNALRVTRITFVPVVGGEQLRLFLVGWDVSTSSSQFPVFPGVQS